MDKLQQSAMEAMLCLARTDDARQCIRETIQNVVQSGYQRIRVARRACAPPVNVHLVTITDPKIFDEQDVQEFGVELQFLIRTNPDGHVILSLDNVHAIASAVLAKLVAAHRLVESLPGKLILISINPPLDDVFRTTKLDQLFDIRENEAAATGSL